MKRMVIGGGLALCVLLMLAPAVSMAQRGPGGGRGFGGGGAMGLLGNEAVAKELELVDDQKQKLRDMQQEFGDQMREMFTGGQDMSREERREKMQKMAEDMQDKVNSVLLPNQQDRLKQIAFQMEVRRGGTASPQSIEAIAQRLELSDDEKEKLLARAEEVRQSLQKKMAEANQAAMDELLSVLSSGQQEKFKTMAGEMVEISRPQFGFGGGQRGQRGRRGGGQGQGRGAPRGPNGAN